MDRNDFGKIIDQPGQFSSAQWAELCRERDRYPFSALLQLLSLMADKVSGAPLWESQSLPRVELYMMDVACAHRQLAALEQCSPAASVLPPPETEAPASDEADARFDILSAINDYQEVSFKTAPKSVILTNFLEKDGGITLSDETPEVVPVQELAKKSIQADDSVYTETLAVILERQGKIEKALAVYEKLMVKNPEKSSTFALQIARLEALLQSMNNN